MSLRVRLIAVVILALSASLAVGGVVVLVNASRSVGNEMRAALTVAQQTADDALDAIGASSEPYGRLDALVDSFKGSRHLRVWVSEGTLNAGVDPPHERPAFGKTPKWFVRVLGVAPETVRMPITIGGRSLGTLVIQTDPRNEVLEIWDALSSSLIVLALFGGLTIALICVFTTRALRPLGLLSAALEKIGEGEYETIQIEGRLAPEFARLRDSFNRMAAQLAAADANNRRLNEQLLTLQEEERSDIAGDLHDQIGPLLFAINVDIANMTRLLRDGRMGELTSSIGSIAEAARDLQRHIRGMLGRLRPMSLAEFGLGEALGDLVSFWRPRHPETEFRLGIAPECATMDGGVNATVYRIVQECVSNALRHGKPRAVTISVGFDALRDKVAIEVADDGGGVRGKFEAGYGLLGMAERIRAMGGHLTLGNRAAIGFSVRAAVPRAGPWANRPLLRLTEAVP